MKLEGRRESTNVSDRRGRMYNHLSMVNSYWHNRNQVPWDKAADRINDETGLNEFKNDQHVKYTGELEDTRRRNASESMKHEQDHVERQDNTKIHRHNWNE